MEDHPERNGFGTVFTRHLHALGTPVQLAKSQFTNESPSTGVLKRKASFLSLNPTLMFSNRTPVCAGTDVPG